MHGNEPIIAMRKRGTSPKVVFLNEYPCPTDWTEFHEYATVEIKPTDAIEALDLRFLIGLTVSISGSTIERAKRIAEACKAAGATTVATGCVESDERGFKRP